MAVHWRRGRSSSAPTESRACAIAGAEGSRQQPERPLGPQARLWARTARARPPGALAMRENSASTTQRLGPDRGGCGLLRLRFQ